jgi:hypothetical protein
MADHKNEDIDVLVKTMQEAMRAADLEFRSYREDEFAAASAGKPADDLAAA